MCSSHYNSIVFQINYTVGLEQGTESLLNFIQCNESVHLFEENWHMYSVDRHNRNTNDSHKNENHLKSHSVYVSSELSTTGMSVNIHPKPKSCAVTDKKNKTQS